MEKKLSHADILQMDRHQRRNFVNTLSGIKNAQLIGTRSADGVDNLGLFNSVVHIGATPPSLGFIMRPLTVERQTYNNIKALGHYTLNQINRNIYEQAHQASAKYDAGRSEFEATGLTPYFSDRCKAPYVKEAQIKIGLEFAEEHYIQINHTWLIVGRIVEVILPGEAIAETGHVDTAALDGVGVSGLDTYYDLEKIGILPYARP
ncbi:MAG TPA: flavin reductase [Saprospiraceae bacterium]|nr:flavin reductase [Saprospiraceae bacterium]